MQARKSIPRVTLGALFAVLLAFIPTAHATPNFDHDPMSITFGGQVGATTGQHSRRHHVQLRFDELPLNAVPIEQTLSISIKTGSATKTSKTIRLRFFDNFDKTKFQRELPKVDYTFDKTTPNPGPITSGVAQFRVIFHKAALDGRQENKIYLVASVNQGRQELGSYCFQTITVYQNQSLHRKPHRRYQVRERAKPS